MKTSSRARPQPAPSHPGLTKLMVRKHARRLFRDKWFRHALTRREWNLAEADLVRVLENESL